MAPMKYTIDKEFPPKHTLTPDEEAFLSALARYTLFLDKSLFFQIDNLQRHTELVLSGEVIMRSEFSNPDELQREIEELKKLIEELRQEDWKLRRLLEERLKDMEDALDNGTYTTMATILRLYFMWIISKTAPETILPKPSI